ncbi:hypothetical protein AAC387_Pa03g1531 [Persea americana]
MGRGHQQQNIKSQDTAPSLVAVAIEAGKNSQHALKWAADHLLSKTQLFFLLHVRSKINTIPTPTGQHFSISEVDEDVASTFLEQIDLQTKELLLPFQCFCNRRGLQCKEVVLDANDIPKAIIDYVVHESIDKLVLGASSRNALTRAFKHADVPTSVSKITPEFCSVYIISKGKLSSVKPATCPIKLPIGVKSRSKFEYTRNSFQSSKSEPTRSTHDEDSVKSAKMMLDPESFNDEGNYYDDIENDMFNRVSKDGGHLDVSFWSVSSCLSPAKPNIDRAFDSGARQSRQSNKCDEYHDHDERTGNFESNRPGEETYRYHDDQMRSFESSRSSGQYWLNGSRSRYSSYGQLSSGSSGAGGDYWSLSVSEY